MLSRKEKHRTQVPVVTALGHSWQSVCTHLMIWWISAGQVALLLTSLTSKGDRVEITGIYRAVPVRQTVFQRAIKSIYKTYIDILHIKKTESTRFRVGLCFLSPPGSPRKIPVLTLSLSIFQASMNVISLKKYCWQKKKCCKNSPKFQVESFCSILAE